MMIHRRSESLIAASLLGFIMVHRGDFFQAFNDAVMSVLQSETMAWLFLVCGLMGSIIIGALTNLVVFGIAVWLSRAAGDVARYW